MKKILTLIACVAALVSCGTAQQPTPIKVISYNIRMSAAPDADGDNRWENRKQASINMINDQQPTLLGLQEACPDQVAFLDENLPDYKRIGVGREDGKAEGEMMAIYYRDADFELEKSGTFWLSETPDQVSMGWDAACKRTCTWVLLRSKADGRRVGYMNTHLDHMGPTARKESIKLIVAKIAELFDKEIPLFLDGRLQLARRRPHLRPPEGRYDRGPQRRPRERQPRHVQRLGPLQRCRHRPHLPARRQAAHLQGALRRELRCALHLGPLSRGADGRVLMPSAAHAATNAEAAIPFMGGCLGVYTSRCGPLI